MRRLHQVPPLGEEPVGAAAAVLEPAPPARHGEGHVRVAGGHAEFPEEPHEIRIGAVVVHQEAGVERHGAVRASMSTVLVWPPRRSLLLEEVHPVPAAQK